MSTGSQINRFRDTETSWNNVTTKIWYRYYESIQFPIRSNNRLNCLLVSALICHNLENLKYYAPLSYFPTIFIISDKKRRLSCIWLSFNWLLSQIWLIFDNLFLLKMNQTHVLENVMRHEFPKCTTILRIF